MAIAWSAAKMTSWSFGRYAAREEEKLRLPRIPGCEPMPVHPAAVAAADRAERAALLISLEGRRALKRRRRKRASLREKAELIDLARADSNQRKDRVRGAAEAASAVLRDRGSALVSVTIHPGDGAVTITPRGALPEAVATAEIAPDEAEAPSPAAVASYEDDFEEEVDAAVAADTLDRALDQQVGSDTLDHRE